MGPPTDELWHSIVDYVATCPERALGRGRGRRQELTHVHLSAQLTHCLWDTMGTFSKYVGHQLMTRVLHKLDTQRLTARRLKLRMNSGRA